MFFQQVSGCVGVWEGGQVNLLVAVMGDRLVQRSAWMLFSYEQLQCIQI